MSDFGKQLEEQIPRLRRYARALTRDVNRAEDLVQDCLARAVAKKHLFRPGTNLRAWLFTLLHNQHVNDVRRAVPYGKPASIDELAPLPIEGNAIPALELKDLEVAITKLPAEQRHVLLLVGLEGMPYEEVASVLNVPIGTVRSRLSRGRDMLRYLMGINEKLSSASQRIHDEPTGNRGIPNKNYRRAA
jgi:RNA polymerase sigma-70 factor (ECF subfamily)